MDMKLPINKEKALELLNLWSQTQSDMNHYLESEAVMGELALRLGEDSEYWGMLGLLHDIDWALTKENTKEHSTKAPEILRKAGFSEEFVQVIVSHTYGYDCGDNLNKKRTKKVEHALAASETITGLIHAYALMRGGRVSDMNIKGLKKKFKDKAFAAGCDREIIREAEKLGITLDEFFEIAIEGIKKIKEEVGLR